MLFIKRIMSKAFFHDFLNKNIWSYQILICHFCHILAQKIAFWAHFSRFLVIFSIMSVIHAYNCTWTLIWHHRPKPVDQSEISAAPRASGISATLMFLSYFFHFYLFFQIFIKSTIFSNKNNNWCFWSSWPPKCCWINWCCWGTSHPKIAAAKQKKIRFFEQKI